MLYRGGLAVLVMVGAFVLGMIAAHAQHRSHHGSDVPQHIQDWYKSVRSKSGIPCCDITDGHPTEYDIRDNAFWVPINGQWMRVPDEAVVYDSKNPTGDAVVWYVTFGSTIFIRCFVPGSGS